MEKSKKKAKGRIKSIFYVFKIPQNMIKPLKG